MRRLGRFLGRLLILLVGAGGALWLFGPYEEADLHAEFDPRRFGEGVQVYFETVESRYDDITPGVEKRVIWQPGFTEQRTPYSVLYVHGFSATSEEIRPVPDRIADALGANLVYTRLRGHGRPGAALAEPVANDWMQDVAEGLAAARAAGEKVIVLSTSTGGTLAAAAALDPVMAENVAAMIFVSPNFGLADPLARFLSWPAARYWMPPLAGRERSFEPASEGEAVYWSNNYPSVAVLPLAALVTAVAALDFSPVTIPALFWLSDDDKVVRPDISRQIAAGWGAGADLQAVTLGPGDDPSAHVITGDIMSPGQTEPAVRGMLDWLAGKGIE